MEPDDCRVVVKLTHGLTIEFSSQLRITKRPGANAKLGQSAKDGVVSSVQIHAHPATSAHGLLSVTSSYKRPHCPNGVVS